MNRRTWRYAAGPLLVLLLLAGIGAAAAAAFPPTSAASSSAGAPVVHAGPPESVDCSQVHTLGLDKQLNLRASAIRVHCGQAQPGGDMAAAGPGNQPRAPLALGGPDADVVTPDGIYPQVTQDESVVWSNGTTTVVNYNDSRSSPNCYSGLSYSTDAGATWHPGQPLCTGHGSNEGVPILVWNAARAHWFAGDIALGCGGQGIGLWTSTDGSTWAPGACAHNGTGDDSDSLWVDNNPASPHYGRMYLAWNDFAVGGGALRAGYSDDGTTWSTPVNVSTAFIRNAQITGSPNGDDAVFLAGLDEGGGGGNPRANLMYRSTDGGQTWATVYTGAPFTPPGANVCGSYFYAIPPIWRYMGAGQPGVGPQAGGQNVVHYVYGVGRAGDLGDIAYIRSTDNGATWSAPIILNTDYPAGTREQWMPSLSVTSQGAVLAAWYDRRNTTNGTNYEYWGRVSTDNGATWGPDQRISDVLIPQPQQPDPNFEACLAGDYNYHTASGTTALTTWTDGRVLLGGNAQQDVFFDKVSLFQGTPTPTVTGSPPTATRTSTPAATPTATATACGQPPAWQIGPDAPPPRYALGGAVAGDGNFYVAGGQTASNTPLAAFGRFNPGTNAWASLTPLPVPAGQVAVGAAPGKILVAGGYIGNFTLTSTLQIYDLAASTWSFGPPLPNALEAAAGVYLNGKFYVLGGDDGNNVLATNYIYDVAANTWSTGAPLPSARTNVAATTASGLIYLFGGCLDASCLTDDDSLFVYNPATNSWTALAPAGTGGFGNYPGLSPYGPDTLLATDGGDINYNPSAGTHFYRISTNTWILGPSLNNPRLAHAQGTLPDGRVIVVAGLASSASTTASVELLGPIPICPTATATRTATPTSTITPPPPTGTPTGTAPTNTPTGTPSGATPTPPATTTSVPSSTAVPPSRTPTGVPSSPTGTPAGATPTGVPSATGTAGPSATPGRPSPTPTPCGIAFSDVHDTDYFYGPVLYLACHGVISGYSDGSYRPYNTTTRAQMVKIVVLGYGYAITTPAGGAHTFADVPVDFPFFAVIETAAAHQVVGGYGCGGLGEPCDPERRPYFRPYADVTRGQLSKIDAVAAGWPLLNPPTATFADVPPGTPFYTYIETAVCRGVISGYSDHSFRPGANATRGQIAKIVYLSIFSSPGACTATPAGR